jgi:hypothetical protein
MAVPGIQVLDRYTIRCKLAQTMGLFRLALGPARDALLRQAKRRILQAATMIPLVYVKTSELVSPKVGGFYYLPRFGWQYENYWLNK